MVKNCREIFAFGVAAAAILVGAAPVSYFPINSQLPPVARISEAFDFTFSPQTFFSNSSITYRLGNAPKWLSVDSSSRRLFGTPSDEDVPPGEVVGIPIELIAEDNTGSTTANPTLVVSRNRPPIVAVPVSEQLPKFGTYIAPSSLHLRPSKPFSFSFDKHTFRTDSGDGGLNYYAVSGDNAPLPSWITFDAGELSFSGKTPPFESLVQPPQIFTFQLVASDVVGFASVSISFSLAVGNHELTADPPMIKLNATHGKPFEYKDLRKVLKLDKKPLKPEDTEAFAALDLPSWLSFDNRTWELNGMPEPTAESSNITIAVMDKYSDTLNLTVSIHFGLFISDLPDLNLNAGSHLLFDLKKYLSRPADTQVEFGQEPEAPWAEFNSSSMTLSGLIPERLSEKAKGPRVAFRATSKHTNETETKMMNIHITSLSSPTVSPQPSAQPTGSGADDSERNLLWLLVIPIFLVFIGIIAILFYIRRRRHPPRRVNVQEVSGPIPGSFVANRPGSGLKISSQNINIVDIGPRRSSGSTEAQKRHSTTAEASRLSFRTASSPSSNGATLPHAMMAMYSRAKSPTHSVILEASSSWSGGQDNQPSPQGTGGTDELSLLSDTSLGEAEAHIAEAQSYVISRRPRDEAFPGLEVPKGLEPFSIQNTPEIAYISGGRHDSSSDEAVPPAVGYAVRSRSKREQDSGSGLRAVGKRISNLWKKESGSQFPTERKRNSILSSSTGQTTRTSILTSGISGGAEEEATTSTNVVARPTIIHIPSRPGEVRRMSRRVDETSPLFKVRSTTQSPRNFGLANRSPETVINDSVELPPNLEDSTKPHNGDTSWDRLARNSLGIAYKDLVTEPEKAIPQGAPAGIAQNNWTTYGWNQDLLSPDQWLQPNVSINMVGIANTSPANTSSKLPRLPHTTALMASKVEGKGGALMRRGPSQASDTTLRNTPSTSSRFDGSYSSREERSHVSRIHSRGHRAIAGGRATASQTPSPENGWGPPTRPLPETPSRAGRRPLGNRPNESSYARAVGGGQGPDVENGPLKSWKTTRSIKSARSLGSVWSEEDDDEDAWEDIRPPTTVDGWDDGGDSNGSFAVYI